MLTDNFENIIVEKVPKQDVRVHNPTGYQLIGKGKHGAVFRISDTKCVKIYADEEIAEREKEAYRAADGSEFLPRIYQVGKNYLVMEYIDGTRLDRYLLEKGTIEKELTLKLMILFKELVRLFRRCDHRIEHIYITKDKSLKVIDHVISFEAGPKTPLRFLAWMRENHFLDAFWEQIKAMDEGLKEQWSRDFNEYSSRKKTPAESPFRYPEGFIDKTKRSF